MNKPDAPVETTHFGYKDVPVEEKAEHVRGVFDSVASRYDIMNDLMSAGLHRLWKRHTIDQAGARPGHQVLDLAGGTGDLAIKFARQVGPTGHVVLADINAAMLQEGRRRLVDAGIAGYDGFRAAAAARPAGDAIVDGRLAAGSRINETHLAADLGLSRTPLREAMDAFVTTTQQHVTGAVVYPFRQAGGSPGGSHFQQARGQVDCRDLGAPLGDLVIA